MIADSLSELYSWSKGRICKLVLLRYQVSKVNGQVPNKVSLLLHEFNSAKASAEIEVDYNADKELPYQAVFRVLPFAKESPRPVSLRPRFANQQQVIHWIGTGEK